MIFKKQNYERKYPEKGEKREIIYSRYFNHFRLEIFL